MKKMCLVLLVFVLLCCSVSSLADEYTDKSVVKSVQQALTDLGYSCGTPDGISGKNTKKAITEFRKAQGLPESDLIDDALLSALGLKEEESDPAAEGAPDGAEPSADNPSGMRIGGTEITGSFDEPALIDPKDRYEIYTDETDGSEDLIFGVLDAMNDEAAEIEEHGALLITENPILNDSGKPITKVQLVIQDSPYGKMIISETRFLWMKAQTYSLKSLDLVYDGNTVEQTDAFTGDDFDFYCESYHFPYGRLETLNGVRQDENGYTYFLVKSDDSMSFEFVVGKDMRILQTRVYEKNEDGHLALLSFVDFEVGPAWEIPQAVLDAIDEQLE